MHKGMLSLGALLLLAGCAGQEGRQQFVWVPDGAPVNCISTFQLRTYRPIDSRTIDFEMTGNRSYRNELPFSCPDLNFGTTIRHGSRSGQLCRGDSITVVRPGLRGPGCQLGSFQPMRRVPVPPEPAEAGS